MRSKYQSFLLIVAIIGCSYSPGDDYYNNFEPVIDQPLLTYELNFDEDTINVSEEFYLRFDFQLENKDLISRVVYFDGIAIDSASEYYFERYFNSLDFSTGYHELELKVYTSSETGSLADVFMAEIFRLDLGKWWLFVDNSIAPNLRVLSTEIENGMLRINFEQYKWPTFVSYTVYKNRMSDIFYQTYDYTKTYFLDSFYIGSDVSYRVDARNINQTVEGILEKIEGDVGFHLVDYEVVHNDSVRLTWTKSPYYYNVRNYEISDQGGLLYTSTDIYDTSGVVSRTFGWPTYYSISVRPKFDPNNNSSAGIKEPIIIDSYGDKLNLVDWASKNENLNVLYTIINSYSSSIGYIISSYSTSGNLISQIQLKEYGFNSENLFSIHYAEIFIRDGINFNILDTLRKEDILSSWDMGGETFYFGDILSVGDDLIAVDLSYSRYENTSEGYIIVDLNSGMLVDSVMEERNKNYVEAFKYYYTGRDEFYSYKDGIKETLGMLEMPQFCRSKIFELEGVTYYRQVFPDYSKPGDWVKIRVYKIPELILVNEIDLEAHIDALILDPQSLNFGLREGVFVNVFDFMSNELIKEVVCNCDVILSNGFLICVESELKFQVY